MFGFLKRAAAKEHMKLMYQNGMAVAYISAFDTPLTDAIEARISAARAGWVPGEVSDDEQVKPMPAANRQLRKACDRTIGNCTKSFDDEHAPFPGWPEYNQRVGGL